MEMKKSGHGNCNVWKDIEPLLLSVEKPARYVGGEINIVRKPDSEVDIRLVLAFPDIYDLGMSYHGFKILYELVNSIEGFQAERTYAPAADFEALLRKNRVPLYTLETYRPLSHCDAIGFTLQHEMSYTNILNMLDLGDIPILSANRDDDDPLIIAGGHGAFNPEILADFIDVFVIGDGEWTLLQILETLRDYKTGRSRSTSVTRGSAQGQRTAKRGVITHSKDDVLSLRSWLIPGASTREDLLFSLAQIPGVYVPSFYDVEYRPDGLIKDIRPNREGVPERVKKTNFDIRSDLSVVRPIVPLIRTVHDRFAVEIKRGCMTGCRFCQAGMITRPLRERPPQDIIEIVREGLRNTGYEEVSLLSLSSADYSQILALTRALHEEFAPKGISISLPSLRINAFDVELADEIGAVRKSGFTFAPEAGTERLRRVINKVVDEERLYATIETVIAKGWRTLKFYFMCGLPTETDEDLDGIVRITERAIEIGRRYYGRNFQLNVSLSPFVPKPQTPFQWHAQPTIEEFQRKYDYVESRLNKRYVSLKKHNIYESVLEGVLSRGDRRVGKAVYRAWQLGCKFDNWQEHFRYDLWLQAFAEVGIDPAFYAHRERTKEEILPWDHIDASLGKQFLWKEKEKSEQLVATEDCSTTRCQGCEVCDFREIKNILSIREDGEFVAPAKPAEGIAKDAHVANSRVRLTYAKAGALRYISHLDLVKILIQLMRRAELPLVFSRGFNPQPKIQLAPPLPLGFEAENEPVDIWLTDFVAAHEILYRLKSMPVNGLTWLNAEAISLDDPSPASDICAAEYRIELSTNSELRDIIWASVLQFQGSKEWPIEVTKKNTVVQRDLRKSVSRIELHSSEDEIVVTLQISLLGGGHVNPLTALRSIVGERIELPQPSRVARTKLFFTRSHTNVV
jgi:radical SAM family uncharacterized protein/radical SAM-linked protein